MKNQWLTFFQGYILVKAEGKGTERFINSLLRSGLPIWNVKRQGTHTITFQLGLLDIHKLRHAARSFEGEISFMRGGGLPFIWKRLMKNSGFLVGIGLFFILIAATSNTIWGIEIKGASPKMEHAIRKELTEMGIKKGKPIFLQKDVESIQKELSNEVEGITWIGVELKGTTYHFQVVEKNEPEKGKVQKPQHIVANKKAVITQMFVEEGQAVVKRNQLVKKGQLLVSGYIGSEENPKEVVAKGVILGETWYKTSVELPLESTFQVYNGNEVRKYHIKIGSFRLPIWGFEKVTYKDFVVEEEERPIKFLKWATPFQFIQTVHRENETVKRTYTKQEAINTAKQLAKKDLESKLEEKAEIVDEKILHQSVENGKVKLSLYFQVIEDIATEQPITQGANENAGRKENN
ncbi:MAG TPA: sporulation protein YqfD [Chondromyces sp.]|nr:sporulation protein YqfD [Chondromyces sp.]